MPRLFSKDLKEGMEVYWFSAARRQPIRATVEEVDEYGAEVLWYREASRIDGDICNAPFRWTDPEPEPYPYHDSDWLFSTEQEAAAHGADLLEKRAHALLERAKELREVKTNG